MDHTRDEASDSGVVRMPRRHGGGSVGEPVLLRLQAQAGNAAVTGLIVQRVKGKPVEPKGRTTRAGTADQKKESKALRGLLREAKSNTRTGEKARKILDQMALSDPAGMSAHLQAESAKEEAETAPKSVAITVPLTDSSGDTINNPKIFDGNRGFSSAFSRQFWALQGASPRCAKRGCKKDDKGESWSIDHKNDWSTLKLACKTVTVCKSGVHWEVVLQQEALCVSWDGTTDVSKFTDLTQRPNLQPMHQSCNSTKSGSKTNDSINPQKVGDCPSGAGCRLRTAV